MKPEVINKLLIDNGIRPLKRRALIYRYLITKKNHPTVETIFSDLSDIEPTLSKTTVYNVLNLFVKKNIVQTISIDGNELRYDADISSHGHFRCISCGKVFDFELKKSQTPALPLNGFKPFQIQYNVLGECAKCAKANLN